MLGHRLYRAESVAGLDLGLFVHQFLHRVRLLRNFLEFGGLRNLRIGFLLVEKLVLQVALFDDVDEGITGQDLRFGLQGTRMLGKRIWNGLISWFGGEDLGERLLIFDVLLELEDFLIRLENEVVQLQLLGVVFVEKFLVFFNFLLQVILFH